ncbi:hypothetical protein P692DRAFT_201861744 [Suillus brevipes Sb2]|nr:hypothetical protein P692DRAFT_201861744 [Suillus brevipes Sb2]
MRDDNVHNSPLFHGHASTPSSGPTESTIHFRKRQLRHVTSTEEKFTKSLIPGTADRGQSDSKVPGGCDDQAYASLVSHHFPICLRVTIPLVQDASLSISRIPAQLPTEP